MVIPRAVSASLVAISLIAAVGGGIVAGDSRYVLAQVYAAEQKTVSDQLVSVKVAVLKSDRRQIQSQLFNLRIKGDTIRTTFENQRIQELEQELEDVQQQILSTIQ